MSEVPDTRPLVLDPAGPRALANTSSWPVTDAGGAGPVLGVCQPLRLPPAASTSDPWALSQCAAQGLLGAYGAGTAASYGTDLRDLFAWATRCGTAPLLLSRLELDLYVRHLLDERRLAVSTVRRRVAVVHQFFLWAVDEGLLRDNPASRMRRPRSHIPPPRVRLSPNDMAALLQAGHAHSARAAVLVSLLLLYGCRIGEVLSLDVEDVHGRPGARSLVVRTKGGVVRELLLSPATSALVDRQVAARRDAPLLASRTGRRWHRTNAARLLRTLGAQVLHPDVAQHLHPHATRRAFVDASLQAGASLPELQHALGHRSAGMVLHYARQHDHGRSPVAWRVAQLLATTSALEHGSSDEEAASP